MSDILGPRLAVVARELTKTHEEVIRAPLPDLVSDSEARKPQGEIVILVEGRTMRLIFDEIDVKIMLQRELRHHQRCRENHC